MDWRPEVWRAFGVYFLGLYGFFVGPSEGHLRGITDPQLNHDAPSDSIKCHLMWYNSARFNKFQYLLMKYKSDLSQTGLFHKLYVQFCSRLLL